MEAELSSEVGAAGRLFKSCIDLYWALLQRTLPLEYKKQQKQALRTEFGRLYFWGDGFYPYDGRLDEILTVSSRLRNRVTSILVEIGGLLCHEKTGLYGLVGRVLVDDRLREQRQEVASLIESIRETLDDPVSSGSESDSGSDVSNEGNQLQDIITALRSRNQGLIDLSGSLERPAADADPPETTAADSVAFIVSGPAEIWTRKVIDTFPDLDTRFAERLGEANWQRYQRVARKLESAEPFDDESESDHEADMSDDDIGVLPHFTETTKSSADPSSIFSSAGRQTATTGTSITTTTFDYAFPMAPRVRMPKDLRSQATYTSLFTNDEGERGWLKIPALPKGAASGKAFRCTVCGDRQQEIINRMEWKRHVFADLEPYLCTFNDCKAGLASFKNRKAWADHEFAVHRVQKIWVCNDCAKEFDQRSLMLEHTYGSHGNVLMRNQLEALVNAAERSVGPAGNNGCPFCLETPATKPRGWAMHVGRHMEEIALAVLPRDFKFEEDKDSFSEHSVVSDGEERQDSEVPETEKKGIMRGIPPGWTVVGTPEYSRVFMDTEGEIYSNELPVFHKERWELEFCKSLMRELKKSRHAPIVRPITSLRTNKSTAYLDLAGVEKKLLNGQYSTAREFTMDIDCLEQAAGSLEDGSISSADYAAWRSFRALFDSEYIKMKDWIRDNELRILGKLQMKQGESEDVASQQATAQRNFKRLELGDFDFLATIGKGNYAKIMLAEFKSSKKLCAVKVLKKDFLVENDEVASISTEKQVLIRAREQAHPFIAMLYGTFQTETRVYFVMEYLGGEISWNLSMRLNLVLEEEFRFYAAEVCHAIQWLHSEQILYRDLKLDNILLAPDGHIKLLDFGLCKVGESVLHGTSTFCGSPEFMAPEILLDKKYGLPVDWWAFGVMIYQLLLRQSPFQGENEDEIYDAILADEPLYPIHMPREAVAIIQKLLTREPGQRLGSSRGALEVMEQPFFKEIDWEKLYRKEIPPPFVPDVTSTDSVANFDPEFTKDAPRLTPVQSILTQAMQEEFRGFSSAPVRDMTQEVPSTNSMQDIPAAYDAYYDSDPQAL